MGGKKKSHCGGGAVGHTCVVNLLCDVDPLPVCQPAVDWCPCGWSQRWVEGIDVVAQVNGPLLPVTQGENNKSHLVALQEVMWAFY